jgi:hypothetical protein
VLGIECGDIEWENLDIKASNLSAYVQLMNAAKIAIDQLTSTGSKGSAESVATAFAASCRQSQNRLEKRLK